MAFEFITNKFKKKDLYSSIDNELVKQRIMADWNKIPLILVYYKYVHNLWSLTGFTQEAVNVNGKHSENIDV